MQENNELQESKEDNKKNYRAPCGQLVHIMQNMANEVQAVR